MRTLFGVAIFVQGDDAAGATGAPLPLSSRLLSNLQNAMHTMLTAGCNMSVMGVLNMSQACTFKIDLCTTARSKECLPSASGARRGQHRSTSRT